MVDEQEAFIENFDLIIQAIESAHNALSIYNTEDEEMQEMEPNQYGMALSNYTLGYIYYNFADQLCDYRIKHKIDFQVFL